jgi:hypothetical protein
MESGVLNAQKRGAVPDGGFDEANRVPLQHAIDETQAGGLTIFVPTGIFKFAGTIELEVATAPSAVGTVSVTGWACPSLVQRDGNNLFSFTYADGDGAVGNVVLAGLVFPGQPHAGDGRERRGQRARSTRETSPRR